MKRYILAISGASGSVFGIRVLEELLKTAEVHLIISQQSFTIIEEETSAPWVKREQGAEETEAALRRHFNTERLYFHANSNLAAPISSGSFRTHGMVVAPCSMKTLSGIAHGYSLGLIERAADVVMKEGRPLIVSPRETPFSAIHLENMLKLAQMGVRIVPPMPAFYHRPQTLEEMIDFISGKILDSLGVENALYRRWG